MEEDNLNEQRIIVQTQKTIELISLDEIVRIEGMQNYSRILLANGDTIKSTKNLGYYKKSLEPFSFILCHKSHLINGRKILRYYKEGSLEMSDTSQVPVSRRMKDALIDCINIMYGLEQHKNNMNH